MNDWNQTAGGDVSGEAPLEITTFYRREVAVIDPRRLTVPGSYPRRRSVESNNRVALALFLATCFSVFLAGTTPGYGFLASLEILEHAAKAATPEPLRGVRPILTFLQDAAAQGTLQSFVGPMLYSGAVYFAAVMTILVAHEMGHYLQARRYRVPASVPYFIPLPTQFGTMGAVILQGAGVADRKSLFDIAISGPLAGLVFALPISIIGIQQAELVQVQLVQEAPVYSHPLLVQWLTRLIHGPIPENYILQWNPWLFAGWIGIFITALNLMPIGQLDGGHILYTLIGRRAHRVAVGLLTAALGFMLFTRWYSYALMVVLLIVAGPRHPPTADDNVPLGRTRTLLGWVTLAFVIIGFTPVPITFTEVQSPKIHGEQTAPAQPDREDRSDDADVIEVHFAAPEDSAFRSASAFTSRSSGSS